MSATATDLRQQIRTHYLCDETLAVKQLVQKSRLSDAARKAISRRAEILVQSVRDNSDPAILESFLAQYGLSSEEGVALMCLAEALLRVPDTATVDTLIHDKIVPADWGRHLGGSSSSLVNASTWALMLTGKLISDQPDGIVGTLRGALRRLGEPVVRTAVGQAIRELGNQFVLGENISAAISASVTAVDKGYTYSYDMLGEAARTDADARRYHLAYSEAIAILGSRCTHDSVAHNPGISVKLSALYPRYEMAKHDDVLITLVARTRSLAMLAKSANMGFNIDAEEADRLDLSLDVIEAVLHEPSLADWSGFGIVVQAYSPRAWYVLDWLYAMATRLDRHIMVRLVKGAYWDSEIKRAQVLGLDGFPVFTRKSNTDISYISCAEKLFRMGDRIYPQFATHNAHTIAAILCMAEAGSAFEFQRLHGMGEALHEHILTTQKTRCRIYAPVGAHVNLLAYLVRRLLENGANSSFVNQIVDESVSVAEIAADPFATVSDSTASLSHPRIKVPADLYLPARRNSYGWDLTDPLTLTRLESARSRFRHHQWCAKPLVPGTTENTAQQRDTITNPACPEDTVGTVIQATPEHIEVALLNAVQSADSWQQVPAAERAQLLERASDLLEAHAAELFALATREAGKTPLDGVAELREAVDFLRYYGSQASVLENRNAGKARGIFVCISPWNFPLAIFCGQIAAALATGNVVIAKPAEQTPLMAYRAVQLMLEAGIPATALQLLPGSGQSVGAALVRDRRVNGVCFTGSTMTAQIIQRSMSAHVSPTAPLIAETGGLNALIVDSTALPEQAVRDILISAFQSAGQRCSALRVLFVQEDIAPQLLEMLTGAMDTLTVGDPWSLACDLGPVIDASAQAKIQTHCNAFADRDQVIHSVEVPANLNGHYVAPVVIRLNTLAELKEEIFGPVLHVIEFAADKFAEVIHQINATGYGLTFGLHSRVDERVQEVVDGIAAGNLYINRNQIGAIVGSQPFGGKGLSGTGPKAGGPHYLLRFLRAAEADKSVNDSHDQVKKVVTLTRTRVQKSIDTQYKVLARTTSAATAARLDIMQQILHKLDDTRLDLSLALAGLDTARAQHHDTLDLPGPTGESNRLSMNAVGVLVCLQGEDTAQWVASVIQCLALGNAVIAIGQDDFPAPLANLLSQFPASFLVGKLATGEYTSLQRIAGVTCTGNEAQLRSLRQALAQRDGAILPLVTSTHDISPLVEETTLCIDTTAAGGNASLLALEESAALADAHKT